MKNEFVSYEQAVALRELGFDEMCFSFFDRDGKLYESEGTYKRNENVWEHEAIAPLKQQVFRWFREKYKLEPEIVSDMFGYVVSIVDRNKPVKIQLSPKNLFQTYEKAENACIDKLIELAKK